VEKTQKAVVERLKPGEELQSALKRIAFEHSIKAGVIVSAVGSLTTASLRMDGANETTTIGGPLEIVSVTGTLSETSMHVHMSVSDSTGKTIGGHLVAGCKVFTTIELVILDLSDEWTFNRKQDEQTTYLELDAIPKQKTKGRIDAN
jgi:predicted DNA-binding protein with PD1-like motif